MSKKVGDSTLKVLTSHNKVGDKWQGRRTTIGAYTVHTLVSAPTMDSWREAQEWADAARTVDEVTTSRELSAPTVVKDEPKPKRRARK